jgi:hypothetical protein
MTQTVQEEVVQKTQEEIDGKVKLSQKDLCLRYGVCKRTVARWCKKGLPHVRNYQNAPEFWLDEVENWFRTQAQSASNTWIDKLSKSNQLT